MNDLLQAASLLGLPLFEQGADGVLRANDAALARGALPAELAAAVARVAGCASDDARLLRLIAAARAGEAASAVFEAARVAAMPGPGGSVYAVVLVASADVERRAALVDAAAEVSHEVSNALSAIAGWAEIARGTRARVDDALDRIETSAHAAREAARGLLGAARGASAAAGPRGAAADAAAMAVDLARTLGPLAASRGARIDAAVTGPALVDDASGQLWTVLWNLVKNAIEAATEGGLVELRVAALPRGVRITVSDDGPGMDVAARERAFIPYLTTKRDGTGLGLPLVKRAVESLGGTVVLEGRRGRGLRVVVTLPLAVSSGGAGASTPRGQGARPRARESGIHDRGVASGRAVLVVEDDTALRELVATALGLRGARVTAVASSAAASALVGPFDLAIIDLTLGDARGDRVLADLRARRVLRGPAIIATGRALPAPLDAEPDAVLRKPFAIDEMIDLVAELAERLPNVDAGRG